jgi:hypothetical protein
MAAESRLLRTAGEKSELHVLTATKANKQRMLATSPVYESNLAGTARFRHNQALSKEFRCQGERAMARLCRLTVMGCLLVAFGADAQVGGSRRVVVLPSPHLIHCRSAECSHLWKEDSSDAAAYPAQVLTDVVHGEIVGLTAEYDKSVSSEDLRSAINAFYPSPKEVLDGLWRFEAEQLVIQLFERSDGTKQLIYLKIVKAGGASSLLPSAHIYPMEQAETPKNSDSMKNAPPDFTGFWKWRCSDAWGVQIKKQAGNLFLVSFCGPGGCFEPGTWKPNTPIVGDPQYHYINPTTLAIFGNLGWETLTKCTSDTNPVLDYSTMPSESPSTNEHGVSQPAPAPNIP